jgi:short-subunit dehydrogenase
VRKNCTYKPDEIYILPLDLENHDSLPQKAKEALDKFGKIDILFNNGGISQRSLVKETLIEVDKRLMNINYWGAVILTKSVLPSMILNKSGHIVVMSSLTGKFGTPLRSSYSASKHALHGFFDSLRAEIYTENIKVTLICSGYIKTKIALNALTEKGESQKSNDPGIENGMPPEYFAVKALNAIKCGKEELILGKKEKMGYYLKRFVPRLFSHIIRTQKVR